MADLLTRVLPLALGAAVSPAVLAIGLLILSSPQRTVARGTAFAAGVLTVLVGLTVVGLALSSHLHGLGRPDPVTRAIDAVIGILLLLLALGTAVRSYLHRAGVTGAEPTPGVRPTGADGGVGDPHTPRITTAYLVGAAAMLTNFSTILLYLPAMEAISRSRVDTAEKAVVVAIVLLITSLPATLPLAIRVVAPTRSEPVLDSVHASVNRHQRAIAVGVEVVLGVWLLAKATRRA